MRKGHIGDHGETAIRTGWSQGGPLRVGGGPSVRCQAQFGTASEFTVQVDSNASANEISAYTQARVTFVINGNPIVRVFDVVAGISVSGLAEAVTVEVQDVTPAGFSSVGDKYNVSISITEDPRPTTAVPPTFSALSNELVDASASTALIPIPAGANSVAVFASTTGLLLTQKTADGTTVVSEVFVANGKFFPLARGAGGVIVTNGTAGDASVSVIFGIDG